MGLRRQCQSNRSIRDDAAAYPGRRHHDERDAKFTAAGEWETGFLIKSAANDSPTMRAEKARTHAELLDNTFTSLFAAKYEEGVTSEQAVAAMIVVLSDSGKKMKDLGDPVDAMYRFSGEV